MKFLIKANQELDCWDVFDKVGLDDGDEGRFIVSFYKFEKAFNYVNLLNEKNKPVR